jgi:hypothetical protein
MADEGGGEELNRDQKAQAITEIAASLSSTDTVIATAFHGLSVREVEDLRGKLREAERAGHYVAGFIDRRKAKISLLSIKGVPIDRREISVGSGVGLIDTDGARNDAICYGSALLHRRAGADIGVIKVGVFRDD